ncbi:hypothetical protein [Gemmatimonas sp.]|jgi:hypothetical protein|uniref:hypothetical protein n=1 Tax=Gemmatimonas sp. TaxID=1962908 RepID=UPI00391F2733
MAISHFVPAPGNYGENYIAVGRTLPATAITAAGTIRHFIGVPASPLTATGRSELLYFKGGALTFGGTASSTTGAVTARIVKRLSGGTIVPISGTVTIPTGTGTGVVLAVPLLAVASDNDLTLKPNAGEALAVEITQAGGGTVATQPGDVQVAVKMAVLR